MAMANDNGAHTMMGNRGKNRRDLPQHLAKMQPMMDAHHKWAASNGQLVQKKAPRIGKLTQDEPNRKVTAQQQRAAQQHDEMSTAHCDQEDQAAMLEEMDSED